MNFESALRFFAFEILTKNIKLREGQFAVAKNARANCDRI